MTHQKNAFVFALLCISFWGTNQMSAMEGVPFQELDEETAEDLEAASHNPPINIPEPKLLSSENVVGASMYTAFTLGLYTFGSLLVAYDHTGWIMPTLSACLLAGGVATNYALVRFCRIKKQEHTRDVAELAEYKPHAQQAIINHRALPWHLRMTDNLINQIYKASKSNNTPALASLVCHLEPDCSTWSPAQEEEQFAVFLTQARNIVESLAAPREEERLPQEEALPISHEMLHNTLAQAVTSNLMKTTIAKYPLKFFSRYYRTECPAEKKGPFAESIAAAATDVHVNNVLSLVQPGKLTDLDKRQIAVTARNAYIHKITALPNPT